MIELGVPAPGSVAEALVLWQFASALADRLWHEYEAEFIEHLMAEEHDDRCEAHPWERRPCPRCEPDGRGASASLELDFDERADAPY